MFRVLMTLVLAVGIIFVAVAAAPRVLGAFISMRAHGSGGGGLFTVSVVGHVTSVEHSSGSDSNAGDVAELRYTMPSGAVRTGTLKLAAHGSRSVDVGQAIPITVSVLNPSHISFDPQSFMRGNARDEAKELAGNSVQRDFASTSHTY